jgi:Zn-dependent membrane protease YugP
LYLLLLAPGMLLAGYASLKVKSTFARASQIGTRRGWTGREVAEALLRDEGIHDVTVEPVNSYLGDHYDPRHKVLRLSPDVYNGRSVAAAGVAAHETGHAMQHAQGYAPLSLRNSIVPVANFGSNFSFIVLIVGLAFALKTLVIVGCALFTMVVLFQVINLPVEFNASRRAKQALLANGMVTEAESKEVSRVLSAAAMTYVAATLTAILTLLYFLIRSGLLGGRRSD